MDYRTFPPRTFAVAIVDPPPLSGFGNMNAVKIDVSVICIAAVNHHTQCNAKGKCNGRHLYKMIPFTKSFPAVWSRPAYGRWVQTASGPCRRWHSPCRPRGRPPARQQRPPQPGSLPGQAPTMAAAFGKDLRVGLGMSDHRAVTHSIKVAVRVEPFQDVGRVFAGRTNSQLQPALCSAVRASRTAAGISAGDICASSLR